MPLEKWVVVTPGTPIVSDFQTTRGQGSPIVIDRSADQAYYLKNNTPTPFGGGGGGGNLNVVDTIPDLETANTSKPSILTQEGRGGVFIFDSSNLSAAVTVDTEQGVYVAPSSDPTGASGAWVRQYSGSLNILWFGAIADDATDAYPAIQCAMDVSGYLALTGLYAPTLFRGGPPVYVPKGAYFIASSLQPLVTIIFEGDGGLGWGAPSRIRSDAGIDAIILQAYNTTGTGSTSSTHFAGDADIIRDIYFLGAFTGTEGDFNGTRAKRASHIERCTFDSFEGDGYFAHANFGAGAPWEGNVNCTRITNCVFMNSRNGVYFEGADANASTLVSNSYMYNRAWGRADRSFLGNHEFGGHFDGNGRMTFNTGLSGAPAAYVSHGGNHYAAIDEQETWCSTNAPSGTTADNQGWAYWKAGAPEAGIPAWFSGMEVRSGGPVIMAGANPASTCYGPHIESNGVSQIGQRCTMLGGTSADVLANTNGTWGRFPNVMTGHSLGLRQQGNFVVEGDFTANRNVDFGDNTDDVVVRMRYLNGGNFIWYNDVLSFDGQFAFNAFWGMMHHTSQLNLSIGTAFGYVDKVTITASGVEAFVDLTVPDEAFGSGWNGSRETPTKNAIYDKITGGLTAAELAALSGGGSSNFLRADGTWNAPSGGSTWSLHASTTIAAPTANIPFTGLAGSTEVMIVCHGVTMSASDVPIVQVSTNNGSSWWTTSGDYIRIPASGSVSNATNGASFWNANASAARSGSVLISCLNVLGAPKFFAARPNDSSPGGLFVADNANDVDAVRLIGNAAANMTGGVVYCFKR